MGSWRGLGIGGVLCSCFFLLIKNVFRWAGLAIRLWFVTDLGCRKEKGFVGQLATKLLLPAILSYDTYHYIPSA